MPLMRSQQRTLLLNAALLVVLLVVSTLTLQCQRIYAGVVSGTTSAMQGPMAQRAHSFAEDVEAHTTRYRPQFTSDGNRDRRRLSFYPVASAVSFVSPVAYGDRWGTAQAKDAEEETLSEAAASVVKHVTTSAVRVRSSIISKSVADAGWAVNVQGWCVQSERVEMSLPTPGTRRTPLSTTSTPMPSSAAPRPQRTAPGPSLLPGDNSSDVSSSNAVSHEDAPSNADTVQRRSSSAVPNTAARVLPKANAVILLMSPTFSSDTLSTVVELGAQTLMGRAATDTAAYPQGVDKSQSPPTASNGTTLSTGAAPTLCSHCSRFLRDMLPALEENYLRRYAYPVHIFHRGSMPNEVVQYITAVLPSAARLTIEDISGVLTEKVTVPSVAVLEPWLKELRSDLLYRNQYNVLTPPPTQASTSTTLDPYKTGPQNGAATDTPRTPAGNQGDAREPNAGKGATAPNSPSPSSAPSTSTVVEMTVEAAVRSLRRNWELRRFWSGLLFLLPSLEGYDYFWFMNSQSLLSKLPARDVLATVADAKCAVAYTRLEYMTHKRVPDLWSSVLAWNEQSVNSYFTRDELSRAEKWLFDGRSFYSGKVYASDFFIFSFAITRHPAYLDFFHWIDSRAPYALMKRQWSPMAVHTVIAELLMSKYSLDSCTLDPVSGYRFPSRDVSNTR